MADTKLPTIAKVLRLRVSVGTEDTRKMAELEADVRAALQGVVKHVTSLGGEYIVDGQLMSVDEFESPYPEDAVAQAEPDPTPTAEDQGGAEGAEEEAPTSVDEDGAADPVTETATLTITTPGVAKLREHGLWLEGKTGAPS